MPAADRQRLLRSRFPDFWFDVAGDPYAIDEPYVVTRRTLEAVRTAAAEAWNVFAQVAPIVRALPEDELSAIGIPRSAIDVCRNGAGPSPTFLGRFDFALTSAGPKLLEFNAETPFFVWESFEIASAMVAAHGFIDPNAGALDVLRFAIARALSDTDKRARVAVTAYNTWREDWFTACFTARIASQALEREVDVVPISELRVNRRGCFDASGRRIDVLWRYYPLEHFARDPAGPTFFARVCDSSVRIVNPACALFAQNKATQAIVWGLRRSEAFDVMTREQIERIFLPTFLDLPEDGERYVRKPVLGREGGGVAIIDAGTIVEASPAPAYALQPAVYQRFVELPTVAFARPCGTRTAGFAVVTCFVVGGTPCAVGMRVGGRITDAWAFMVPLAL